MFKHAHTNMFVYTWGSTEKSSDQQRSVIGKFFLPLPHSQLFFGMLLLWNFTHTRIRLPEIDFNFKILLVVEKFITAFIAVVNFCGNNFKSFFFYGYNFKNSKEKATTMVIGTKIQTQKKERRKRNGKSLTGYHSSFIRQGKWIKLLCVPIKKNVTK